jgi:histidinol-phosphate/aromatic aminotransferase/cobyric acid decarboxylase-like protein/CTP:molybdopterin cytidylyltransferase MocA
MKALILAAGYGNRMRPLTDSTHKTLLRVGGQTLIGRIVDSLRAHAITDIVVVTGHLADDLESALIAAYPDLSFTFVRNLRYRETNNIYSLALAFESIDLDDDILLIESDLVYEPAVLARIVESRHPNVALVDRFRSGMDGTVVTVGDQLIRSIIPPHLQGPSFDFSDKFKTLNIYKFSRQFSASVFKQLLSYYTKAIDDNCYYELILGILIYVGQAQIHAEILDGERWAELDDPNDLRVAEFVFDRAARGALIDEAFGGLWAHDVLDFGFIRNMHFPPGAMLAEMKNNLGNLLANYGSRQTVLDQKLAYALLCDPAHVLALNGASQAYPLLRRYFYGRRILMPEPTFGEYVRLGDHRVTYPDTIGIDPDAIERRARDCSVVIVVNPNNPTGSTISTEWLMDFAARHPGKRLLVDESFIDFSGEVSMLERLRDRPLDNVVVLKSLSKCFGVPGLRLGFMYTTDRDLLARCRAEVPIWNMNSMAEFFLEVLLKHRRALGQSFRQTMADRDELAAALAAVPAVERVFPSGANFLLARIAGGPGAAAALAAALLADHAIYVKDVSPRLPDGRGYWRIAVRLPEENRRLLTVLESASSQEQARARAA